jgi:hypothetical protein
MHISERRLEIEPCPIHTIKFVQSAVLCLSTFTLLASKYIYRLVFLSRVRTREKVIPENIYNNNTSKKKINRILVDFLFSLSNLLLLYVVAVVIL